MQPANFVVKAGDQTLLDSNDEIVQMNVSLGVDLFVGLTLLKIGEVASVEEMVSKRANYSLYVDG